MTDAAQEAVLTMKAPSPAPRAHARGPRRVPGVETVAPDGAFYVFPNFSRYVDRFPDDVALATWLLEEKLVASVPGSAFGAPGHLRMSFASEREDLRGAVPHPAAISRCLERAGEGLDPGGRRDRSGSGWPGLASPGRVVQGMACS